MCEGTPQIKKETSTGYVRETRHMRKKKRKKPAWDVYEKLLA